MNTPHTYDRQRPDEPTGAALIVVDVQNDFCEGGSLAVAGGREVASRISAHLALHAHAYDVIVATRDTHDGHSTNGGHFAEPGADPDYVTTWPAHCVAHTRGQDYAPELALRHVDVHVKKGMGVAAYSGFEGITEDGRTLLDALLAGNVTDVVVVGIATDYCVRATALHAAENGFRVTVHDQLTAAVAPETKRAAVVEMQEAGITYVVDAGSPA